MPDGDVILDTSVGSLVLRRPRSRLSDTENDFRDEWARLVLDGRRLLLGVVRQELLSGIRNQAQYLRLRSELTSIPHTSLDSPDYERAADFSNICRRSGLQGSSVDFLICSASVRYDAPILTIDRDFDRFATLLPIRLHPI